MQNIAIYAIVPQAIWGIFVKSGKFSNIIAKIKQKKPVKPVWTVDINNVLTFFRYLEVRTNMHAPLKAPIKASNSPFPKIINPPTLQKKNRPATTSVIGKNIFFSIFDFKIKKENNGTKIMAILIIKPTLIAVV